MELGARALHGRRCAEYRYLFRHLGSRLHGIALSNQKYSIPAAAATAAAAAAATCTVSDEVSQSMS
jgi:hypothetical protein